MQVTCGDCGKFARTREGATTGWCMGVRVAKGERRPVVHENNDARECPDRQHRPPACQPAPARRAPTRTPTNDTRQRKQGEPEEARPTAAEIRRPNMGTLDKLSDGLFAELERLGELDMGDAEKVDAEIRRAKSICNVAAQITANNANALNAVRLQASLAKKGLGQPETEAIPRMLGA